MNYELILEIIAVITGMLSIWYSYRINILVYPIGMISLALYVFIFIKNGLYANAVINFLYFVISIFGWWNWLRQRTTDNGQQTTDGGQQTTNNRQRTADNRQRTMNDNSKIRGERKLENLKIWNDSRAFVNEIYQMISSCRDYGFRDQIQRASVSIMNNVAEGFESGSDGLFVRYLQVAKGSCSEVKSMLFLCEDFHICTKERRLELQIKLYEISSGLYKLIHYLNGK